MIDIIITYFYPKLEALNWNKLARVARRGNLNGWIGTVWTRVCKIVIIIIKFEPFEVWQERRTSLDRLNLLHELRAANAPVALGYQKAKASQL